MTYDEMELEQREGLIKDLFLVLQQKEKNEAGG